MLFLHFTEVSRADELSVARQKIVFQLAPLVRARRECNKLNVSYTKATHDFKRCLSLSLNYVSKC